MAKKKNKPVNTGNQPAVVPASSHKQHTTPVAKKTDACGFQFTPTVQFIMMAGIALITWLFLHSCLDNQLTNWDDPGYIRDNQLIKDLSGDGIKNIFSQSVMGNYHPLTILSYAIEYSFVRLEPYLYHFDSLLLHVLITLLVYWFVNLLTCRPVAAAITALLFGLHPMHVESVAWLAGRKDVLYGLFYVAACIVYIYYERATSSKKWLWYAMVLILFVCSLLSKPVAVTLPVTLLLIDYFEQRKWNYAVFIEKIPHFLIAIGFGLKSVKDQQTFKALGTQNVSYNFFERIELGAYALTSYLWKAIAPLNLSCFYPYPEKPLGGTLPIVYFIYPVVIIIVIVAVWIFGRKNKIVVFGSLFFLVNIALLLQFIPVGGAIIADRYSYIAYLGLFFMAGWLVSGFLEPGAKKERGYAALAIIIAYCFYLGYLSNERCKVWYDTTSLWRDEIEKQPDAPNAYNNLGFDYFNKFNETMNQAEKQLYFDSSNYLLNKSISLQKDFANPYVSLGELYRSVGKLNEARSYYYKALSLKDDEGSANAYLGLGIIYAISGHYDSSAFSFREAIRLKPYFPEAHSNFGNFWDMTHHSDSAYKEYTTAIAQDPDMYASHLNRGRLLQREKRCDEAMQDFELALQLKPDMGEIYYARSYCYTQKGNKTQALQDVEKARSLGFTQIDNAYYQMLKGGR